MLRPGTVSYTHLDVYKRQVEWCSEHLQGVVRLFHRNHQVEMFNYQAIPQSECMQKIADDLVTGFKSDTERIMAVMHLHKMSLAESGSLPYKIDLATGNPYTITVNVDVEDGIVSGAIGTLRHIEIFDNSTTDQPSVSYTHLSLRRLRHKCEFAEEYRAQV